MHNPAQPAPAWTDQVLDLMRQVTDPLADAVVADVFQHGQAEAVNTLMRTLIENDDLPSDHLPPGMREYLATSAQLPAWVEPDHLTALAFAALLLTAAGYWMARWNPAYMLLSIAGLGLNWFGDSLDGTLALRFGEAYVRFQEIAVR